MTVLPSTMANTVTSTVEKLAGPLDEARKPAFAMAGLADLALEQVKQAPAAYGAEVRRAQERLAEVPALVRTWPSRVEELRGDVETRVGKAGEQVGELYAALAVRGERLVRTIRRQPATEVAVAEAHETVKRVRQAGTAARTSARAGAKAAKGAADTLG